MNEVQEIEEQIGEIVNHVDSTNDKRNKFMNDVENALTVLESEQENLSIFLDEKLNQVLSTKFKLDKNLERHKDTRDVASENLALAENRLADVREEEEKMERKKEAAKERVEAAKKDLDNFKAEVEKVSELAANVPKLSQSKKLYYSICRLTFDKSASKKEIKGFVVNPRKEDVNTFNFNSDEEGISSHFITNYLWDLIAAGAAPEWDNV